MTEQEILTLFSQILRDLLGDDSIVLGMQTRRSDVPDWDSFGYVTFIAAAEMQLGIKYRIADVESFATVGDIVAQTKVLQKNLKS
jgi:acyl carrier protein